MKTLQLSNGDLVLSNGAFAMIEGPARVQQDVMVACLTPLGSNQFHVKYGSVFSNYIGLPATMSIQALVNNEFNRILQNYITIQTAQVKAAVAKGIQSPFTQNEVILSVQNIDVQQSGTDYLVTATVITGSSSQLILSATASAS